MERRRHPRVTVEQGAELRHQTDVWDCVVHDLSACGALLELHCDNDECARIGVDDRMTLLLPVEDAVLELPCELVRRDAAGEHANLGVELRLEDVERATRKNYARWLFAAL